MRGWAVVHRLEELDCLMFCFHNLSWQDDVLSVGATAAAAAAPMLPSPQDLQMRMGEAPFSESAKLLQPKGSFQKSVGLLLEGHPEKGRQFAETAKEPMTKVFADFGSHAVRNTTTCRPRLLAWVSGRSLHGKP